MKDTMQLTADLVALCQFEIADAGPPSGYEAFTDADFAWATDKIMQEKPAGALWIFAYGSLIWKPEFPVLETRRAKANGWSRAFSLKIDRFRGSTEQHGYMMCLDQGGECEGVALKLSDDDVRGQIELVLRREVDSHLTFQSTRWISLETDEGPVVALTFYAAPLELDIYQAQRPLSEVAQGLARACGHLGSGAEYLYNTVSHLEALGIHDEGLWTLQAMVAAEIQAIHKL